MTYKPEDIKPKQCPDCGSKRMEKLTQYRCPDCGSRFDVADRGWISVEDRLPIKHIGVIILVEAGSWCKGWSDHEERWRPFDTSVSYETYVPMVTHWTPLPEPPKEDE